MLLHWIIALLAVLATGFAAGWYGCRWYVRHTEHHLWTYLRHIKAQLQAIAHKLGVEEL